MVASNSPSSKRKFITAILLSTLLTTALAGALLADLATANPVAIYRKFPPPIISLSLPENQVYTTNKIPVAFTFKAPLTTKVIIGYHYSYILNGVNKVFRPTSQVSTDSRTYSCTASLSGLSEGVHRLSIVARLTYQLSLWGSTNIDEVSGFSDTVVFTVNAAAPRVWILSLKPSETYDTATLPLDFNVSEPGNWLGYSLDGEAPVTVTGNTTLYGLSEGTHRLIVHAEDTTGSTGASLPVTFKVKTQAAAQPTEPQPVPFPNTWIASSMVASVAAISFGLVAYFIRRKGKRSET